MNILMITLFLPLIGSFILFLIPSKFSLLLKQISFIFSFLTLLWSLFLWIEFHPLILKFQFFKSFTWVYGFNFFFNFGVDGISLFFIILTTFLFNLCILYNWTNIQYSLKEYFISLFLIEFFLLLIFMSLDIFLFYFFFESILIPMFLLIGLWGSRAKKIKASYLFFFYTLIGSVPFLIGIMYIYLTYGITSFPFLFWIDFTFNEQVALWFMFFFSFASKVPMLPFHIWLPEAHVEAPTTGSIILAGILLKLGIYGFLRFLIPLFPLANNYLLPFVYTLAIIGIIYPALTAIRQTDLKRIIAYSSISHMNLVILGVFSFSLTGIQGAILQSLSHGFVASGLFFLIGFLYDRYHTRIVKYYSGLFNQMPLFSFFFLFFILSNIAVPGTSNFTGEFLILLNSFFINKFITIIGTTGMIFGGMYSLWLTNKILYGNLKTNYLHHFNDLTLSELIIITILTLLILIVGIYPKYILTYLIIL